MKKCLTVLSFILLSIIGYGQIVSFNGEYFKIDTLYPLYDIPSHNKGLSFPWEITYGPDDSLWITEAHRYRIWKIHPGNKGNRVLLDLSSFTTFNYYNPPNGYPAPQGGLMGLALHPLLLSGKPYVYVAMVYDVYPTTGTPNNSYCSGSGSVTNNPCYYKTKIIRYTYDLVSHSLGSPTIVMDNLMGSNDHNSGRLKISPVPESDGKYHLYYTIGDQGAGQFNNGLRTNNAQNKDVYEGKVLRLNTETDGDSDDGAFSQWIPNDNPVQNSVSGKINAVYSYGHRNAQGLVWAHIGSQFVLFNSEHGDKSDDEVNVIRAGGNYGWPKVAGMCDDNYNDTDANPNNDKLANQTIHNERSFCSANNIAEPLFSFFNVNGSAVPSSGSSNYTWPTIAPSSIDYYDKFYIPGWNNSLLVTSLKLGMYRLKLKTDGSSVDSSSTAQITDTIPYLHEYRIRDLAIAPTGDTLFLAIDSSGSTSGPTGGFTGTTIATKTPGYILRMIYLTILPEGAKLPPAPKPEKINTTLVFPNPATDHIHVLCRDFLQAPFHVQMFDMSGRNVLTQTFFANNFDVPLQNIREGLYVFRLFDAQGTLVIIKKILVISR
ncbi:MAG: PQQ-dependent sugar dehydrogenase [Bacteroidota bacterium]|nr:PQQ-dependent sugar dehydrogenase [Bacteroidota bacterium]